MVLVVLDEVVSSLGDVGDETVGGPVVDVVLVLTELLSANEGQLRCSM